jgi:competence protein ComEC
MKYPVITFSSLFTAGLAVSQFFHLPFISFLVLLSIFLITVFYYYGSGNRDIISRLLFIEIYIITFFCGMLYYSPPLPFDYKDELHKEDVTFYGSVADISISGNEEVRFTALSDSITSVNKKIIYSGIFNCISKDINCEKGKLFPGNKIKLNGKYIKGKNTRNPGEINYEEYLNRNGISGYICSYSNEDLVVVEEEKNIPAYCIFIIRKSVAEILKSNFSPDASAFLQGILLADRRDIDQEVKTNFINSGTSHILAVSGLHTGFIIIIFMFLTGRLNIYLRVIFISAGIISFALITGAPPSVQRATLMTLVILIAFVTNRSTNIYNSLALSALLILLYNPAEIFLPGFQLSFMAVLSIAFIYPQIKIVVDEKVKNGLIKKILLFTGVSIAAQIGTMPLTLYYFNKLSFVSLAANLFVIPIVGFILGAALLTVIFTFISGYAAVVFAAAAEALISIMYLIVDISGSSSISFLWVYDFSFRDAYVFYFLMFLFFLLKNKMLTFFRKTIFGLLLIALTIICISFDDKDLLKENYLNCYMIDVGQGDAILLKFPGGKTALIDAGQSTINYDSGERIIEPLLNYLGIKKIDYAFISHLDSDHYSGFVHLIHNNYIEYLFKPRPDTSAKELKFENYLKKEGINFSYYSSNELAIDGAKLYILDNAALQNKKVTSNDLSGVILLVYGNNKFLFTGDAGKKAEIYYSEKYGQLLTTNVLKVSHHGSSTATSEEFLYISKPEISLISAGEKNHFGHPSPETIKRLMFTGSRVYRTDEEGGILLQSDGFNISKINWKEN